MAKRATIHDVARLSGFSTTAVSNALNNKDARISKATRGKILDAARQLHYSPNALIRAIHSGRTRVLGMFMIQSSVASRRLLSEMLIHIQRFAAERGHDLLLHCCEPGHEQEETAARFLDGRIDGLFYWGARPAPFVKDLLERDFPVVSLFSSLEAPQAGRVWADETVGLRAALLRLIELGHKEVHFTPYSFESPAVVLRRQALDTLRAELPIRIVQGDPFQTPQDRIGWLERLFNSSRPPTAIIPGGTQDGYYALAVAQRRGWRVPDDLSIVCHEGLDAESGFGISSVRAPLTDFCREAVDLALDLIEGRPRASREICLPTTFFEGNTLAPPRAAASRARKQ